MKIEITKPIIEQIKEITKDIPGWCPEDQLFAMYLLAISTKDLEGEFLEIGSWCGKSATVLAIAADKIGTKLNCIDLFPNKEDWFENEDGTFSFKVKINEKEHYGCSSQTVWKEPYERDILSLYNKSNNGIFEIFNSNMKKNGLDDVVKPFKGTSEGFALEFNKKIKIAFVDGDHGYESTCKDIINVVRFLVSGGWVIFDDAFTVNKGVDKAINEKIIDSGKYELLNQITRKCFIARRK